MSKDGEVCNGTCYTTIKVSYIFHILLYSFLLKLKAPLL